MSLKASTIRERGYWFTTLFISLVVFVTITWLSLAQFHAYNTVAFDAARISEALWHTLHGQPLHYTSEGLPLSRLADHVEIFYFLLVPIYALRSSPTTLLVIQAALYVSAALPVFQLTRRKLNSSKLGLLMASIYLFYPVAQTAVLFEFHGDTLAMPLLLFALNALDLQKWRSYAIWVALALSCKFYVAVPVVFMGALLCLRGQRRVGAWTLAGAVFWGAFTFFGIRSWLAPDIGASAAKATAGSYLTFYFGQLSQVRADLPLRLIHGILVILPVVLIGRRALGWLFVASTIVLPVLISTGPGPVYSYEYHHYALAVPFFIMALIEGAAHLQQQNADGSATPAEQEAFLKRPLLFTFVITLVLNVIAVDTPLNPRFYLAAPGSGNGLSSTGYRVQPRDNFKDRWLAANVPDEAVVAADRTLGPRLINRPVLYLTQPTYAPLPELLPEIEYVVVDALYDYVLGANGRAINGGIAMEHGTIQLLMHNGSWQLERAQDGLLLFSKTEDGLAQQVDVPSAGETLTVLAQHDDAIELVDFEVEARGERRFHLQYTWRALRALQEEAPLIAVSRLDGVDFSRIVHLPTLGLHPTTLWETGTVVSESFEVELPPDMPAGDYPLVVGWYDTGSLYAAATDERSRVGGEIQVGVLEVR